MKKTILAVILVLSIQSIQAQEISDPNNVLNTKLHHHIIISIENDSSKWDHIDSYTGIFEEYKNFADSLLQHFFNKTSNKKKIVVIAGHQKLIVIEYLKSKKNETWYIINQAEISTIEFNNTVNDPLLKQQNTTSLILTTGEILVNKETGTIWFKNINK